MKIFVLPGLDGVASLRSKFAEELALTHDVIVLDYPQVEWTTYDAVADFVLERITTNEKFCIVAESFSGPTAIRIAARGSENLAGLVFAASFAIPPNPYVSIAAQLAMFTPRKNATFAWLISHVLSSGADRAVSQALAACLKELPSDLVQRRLSLVAQASELNRLSGLNIPMLYLRAKRDWLVGRACCARMVEANSLIRIATIDGPHFILGVKSKESAGLVNSFVAKL